jgi:O-antigen ligase
VNKTQRITLLIFFFSINFEVWELFNTGGYFSISKLAGIIYFLSTITDFKQFFRTDELGPLLWPVWIFFVWLTFVSLININWVSSAFFNFSTFQVIILFWILINHERRDPGILFHGMLSFAFGSIVLALLYHAGIGVQYSHDGRVVLFGDNENIVGLRMSISMIVILICVFQNVLKLNALRYLLLTPLPIMLNLLAETGSRIAFLSCTLMFMGWFLFFKTKKSSYKIIIVAIGVVVIIFIVQYIMQSEIMLLRLLKSSETGDIGKRDDIWFSLFPIIMDNLIFGIGETGYALSAGVLSPHNVLLEVLCYSGIIGLILFLIFIVKITIRSVSTYRRTGLIIFPLLLIPVYLLILSGQMLYSKMVWVIFSYIVSHSLSNRLEINSKPVSQPCVQDQL